MYCFSIHSTSIFLTYTQARKRSNGDDQVPARWFSLTCSYSNIFLFWLKTVKTNSHGSSMGKGFVGFVGFFLIKENPNGFTEKQFAAHYKGTRWREKTNISTVLLK